MLLKELNEAWLENFWFLHLIMHKNPLNLDSLPPRGKSIAVILRENNTKFTFR
jgi:hypothetical protein